MMRCTFIVLLDEAVQFARDLGLPAEGWTMQRDNDGYIAWLFYIEDDVQKSLFPDVLTCQTPDEAADWCIKKVKDLKFE